MKQVGARPLLPCEGSNEPCTRLSMSRYIPARAATEASRRATRRKTAPGRAYATNSFQIGK